MDDGILVGTCGDKLSGIRTGDEDGEFIGDGGYNDGEEVSFPPDFLCDESSLGFAVGLCV